MDDQHVYQRDDRRCRVCGAHVGREDYGGLRLCPRHLAEARKSTPPFVDGSRARERMADVIFRNVALRPPVHDEPMPGSWFCGECPYMNAGVMCSKCGAPRWKGTEAKRA